MRNEALGNAPIERFGYSARRKPGPWVELGDRVRYRFDYRSVPAGTLGTVKRRCGCGHIEVTLDDGRVFKSPTWYLSFLKLEKNRGAA